MIYYSQWLLDVIAVGLKNHLTSGREENREEDRSRCCNLIWKNVPNDVRTFHKATPIGSNTSSSTTIGSKLLR